MKEIVVIPKEHIEYEQISGAGFATIRFHLGTDKFLEVPETWEDFVELSERIGKVYKKDNEYISFDIGVCVIIFVKDGGRVSFYTQDGNCYCVKEQRTPAQMWQIIKSLIGEE